MPEFLIVGSAVLALVVVARWGRPVRLTTAFLLAVLTVAWIWANLRTSGWQEAFSVRTPDGLDWVTRSMFWRGWPLAPAMFCLIHGLRFRPNGSERWALVFDWLVLFIILLLARFASERCSFRRTKNSDGTTRTQGGPPLNTPG
jgi:hypothetical protein